jgi:hypothetical protein
LSPSSQIDLVIEEVQNAFWTWKSVEIERDACMRFEGQRLHLFISIMAFTLSTGASPVEAVRRNDGGVIPGECGMYQGTQTDSVSRWYTNSLISGKGI